MDAVSDDLATQCSEASVSTSSAGLGHEHDLAGYGTTSLVLNPIDRDHIAPAPDWAHTAAHDVPQITQSISCPAALFSMPTFESSFRFYVDPFVPSTPVSGDQLANTSTSDYIASIISQSSYLHASPLAGASDSRMTRTRRLPDEFTEHVIGSGRKRVRLNVTSRARPRAVSAAAGVRGGRATGRRVVSSSATALAGSPPRNGKSGKENHPLGEESDSGGMA